MTNGLGNQLAALQRIAAFSVGVRGHALGEWQIGEDHAASSCIRCGAAVRVYFPALQAEMDGPALGLLCNQGASERTAA